MVCSVAVAVGVAVTNNWPEHSQQTTGYSRTAGKQFFGRQTFAAAQRSRTRPLCRHRSRLHQQFQPQQHTTAMAAAWRGADVTARMKASLFLQAICFCEMSGTDSSVVRELSPETVHSIDRLSALLADDQTNLSAGQQWDSESVHGSYETKKLL